MEEKEKCEKVTEEAVKAVNKNFGFKKKIIIIIAALAIALALCVIVIGIIEAGKDKENDRKTYPPIDEALLSDTKPEGFDIMEYDEYVDGHDINIYYDNGFGVTVSVSEDTSGNYGEAFSVVYNVLLAIRDGDSERYNLYMGSDKLKKSDFTQQQIYDVTVTFQPGEADGSDASIYKVEYKIHENNGTYRNNIESDASRPIYFIVKKSSGQMVVTDMIEP